MRRKKIAKRGERGATLLEFTIGALVFFIALFGVLECSRLLWTHNALADAARRGARHAIVCPRNEDRVRKVVVYGDPAGGAQPVVPGLTATDDRVEVLYTDFGVKQGTVSVRITGYQFTFAIPLIGTTLAMPDYQTTLTGESAGCLPPGCTTPSGC